jgi:hypothetical protein
MAQPDFIAPTTLRVTAPKPKMTVYYGLLIIALMCILIACLFLYLEVRRFGGFGTVPQRIAALGTSGIFGHHGGTETTEEDKADLSLQICHLSYGHFRNDQFQMTNYQ